MGDHVVIVNAEKVRCLGLGYHLCPIVYKGQPSLLPPHSFAPSPSTRRKSTCPPPLPIRISLLLVVVVLTLRFFTETDPIHGKQVAG
jgi:hypothetical protein